MVEKTNVKGIAEKNRYGESIVKMCKNKKEFNIYHYGTLILKINLEKNEPVSFGGAYSHSDRDIINNALDCLGIYPQSYARIKNGSLEVYNKGVYYVPQTIKQA